MFNLLRFYVRRTTAVAWAVGEGVQYGGEAVGYGGLDSLSGCSELWEHALILLTVELEE
jgi:hypothetical protein